MSEQNQPSHPGQFIKDRVIPSDVSVSEASRMLRVSRPALSKLLNGKAALSKQMATRLEKAFGFGKEELLAKQKAYDDFLHLSHERQITVRSYAPSFLDIRAKNIEEWSEGLDARSRLPALLRRLVHSTGAKSTKVDFPAYDFSQKHGWDGYVVCEEPNSWVPGGISGWEFGCGAKPRAKANKDYKARSKSVSASDRKEMTFVFVTPRLWPKKAAWVDKKKVEGKWKDVRAFDANDLEQWLECSASAQSWFGRLLGINTEGVQALSTYWENWAVIAEPAISPKIFESNIEAHLGRIKSWLEGQGENHLIVAASSKEEGVAFLAAVAKLKDDLQEFWQQSIFIQKPEAAAKLSAIPSGFIPVIYSGPIEKELATSYVNRKAVIITDRNVTSGNPDIVVELPTYESFQTAIKEMGLDEGKAASIARGSGRSPTILRRLLAKTPELRKPTWVQNTEHAGWLVPLVLVGRWKSRSAGDQEILQYVTDEPYEKIERRVAVLAALDDPPIWSEGRLRGIASKFESLHGIADRITVHDLERFIFVAECVLAEEDPALELDRSDQWAAAVYGKVRDHSATLRQSICDTLVLLAVHGPNLFGSRLDFPVEFRIESLIRQLLKDKSPKDWQSQKSDLPSYAEAAPDEFLDIIEEELRKDEPAFSCLFEPVESGVFDRCERTGMLWALELLAWDPTHLARVINVLASLCRYELNDNWVNTPVASIRDILLSWRPYTTASLEQRIEVVEQLCKKFQEVGWCFCINQNSQYSHTTSGTYKPHWRDDVGAKHLGVTDSDAYIFQRKCLDLVLNWPSYDRAKLEDLINIFGIIPKSDRDTVKSHIETWLERATPSQGDIAALREHVRSRTLTRRRRRQEEGCADGRAIYKLLEPKDVLDRHGWLFAKQWLNYSPEDLQEEVFDHEKHNQLILAKRTEALEEILRVHGYEGVYRLCRVGDTAFLIGEILGRKIMSRNELLKFTISALGNGNEQDLDKRDQCISGLIHQFEEGEFVRFLRDIIAAWDDKCDAEQLVRIHRLAPSCSANWEMLKTHGGDILGQYWKTVSVGWKRYEDNDLNYCVMKLMKAGRPRAAFRVAQFDCDKLDTDMLINLLQEIGTNNSEPEAHYKYEAHDIIQALETLNESPDANRMELAKLEHLYLPAIATYTDYAFPNLSGEIVRSPSTYIHFIALCFRRDDKQEDGEELNLPTDSELKANVAKHAYEVLKNVTVIPGTEKDGKINVASLGSWVAEVRALAQKHGLLMSADRQIGHLLQKGGVDDQGIWPRKEVREVIEKIASPDIMLGLEIAERNTRGVQRRPRPDNGDPERELVVKYKGFGESIMNRTPFVASMLFSIAKGYERDASYHDTNGPLEARLQD